MSTRTLAETLVNFLKRRYGREISSRWYRDPFKILVSCVLSQRTREENTDAASHALFAVASTPAEILRVPEAKLRRLIKPAGFARQKTKRIIQISRILITRYRGKVPRTKEELLTLPGVGPKTANVVLCYGFNVPCIPVDTHVNRISRRLGIVEADAKLEEVEPALRKAFSEKDWPILNRGLVLFGREICLPRFPRCRECELNRLCQTGRRKLKGSRPVAMEGKR